MSLYNQPSGQPWPRVRNVQMGGVREVDVGLKLDVEALSRLSILRHKVSDTPVDQMKIQDPMLGAIR